MTPEPTAATAPDHLWEGPNGERIARDLEQFIGPADELRLYRKNPRKGNVAAIGESLEAHGQVRAILVNRGTHAAVQNEVLAGNHTLIAASERGWALIARTFVDVDDDEAARIVLADNRTAELGTTDDETLVEVLRDLPDLAGTGYDQLAFEGILKRYEQAGGVDPAPPDDFRTVDPDDLEVEYECPSCGYGWRGKPKPGTADPEG